MYGPIQNNEIRLVKFGHADDPTSAILQAFPLEGLYLPFMPSRTLILSDESSGTRNHVLQMEARHFPKNAQVTDTWQERSQHVQLMGSIYRNADMLIVWLGQSDDADLIIDFIKLLNQRTTQSVFNPAEIRSIFEQDEYRLRCARKMFPEGVVLRSKRRVWRLRELGDKQGAKSSRSLVALVAYSSCFDATDDRDRLQGIRALATDFFLLDVNYASRVEDVYCHFAKPIIEHYKGLNIISFAALCPPGSPLPSWVPDWRTTVDLLSVSLMDSSLFCAASKGPGAVYEFYSSSLLGLGIILGTVDGLTRCKDAGFVQSSAVSPSQTSSLKLLERVCRSLVLGWKDWFMRLAMLLQEFFRDFIWLCAQLIMESASGVPKLDEDIMDSFFGRFFDTVVRMSLRLMKGDLVCVLLCCSVPVLLRPSERRDAFPLVGECFPDGSMDGAGVEQDQFEERVFRIE
ncbi:hypothetical protein F5Y16DRAFT_408888 [Xylariaceae sp. FL0255]|nr:hypothetical protein F5Y16DRAFT_408888 [Xylariaceae sp. FL0255]